MPRRRPGTLFPLEVDVLQAASELQAVGDPVYGYALAKQIAGGPSNLIAHGTLYKSLSKMTESGLLRAEWEAPDLPEIENRPRRRLYTVTAEGASALVAARSRAHPVRISMRPALS